jgi:hypothetical protein
MHEKTIEAVKGLEADLAKIEPRTVHTRAAINALAGVRNMLSDDEKVREQADKERAAAEAKRLEAARKVVAEADSAKVKSK